jgi:hypothetical protein
MDSLSEYLSRTQKSEGNGTHDKSSDFMNMRNKPKETRENLRGSSHTADYERGIDCLIRGLVDLLPKPDSVWTIEDRAKRHIKKRHLSEKDMLSVLIWCRMRGRALCTQRPRHVETLMTRFCGQFVTLDPCESSSVCVHRKLEA